MRRYIMIGAPVTSVRTPPLLAACLTARGVPATCETVHVEPDGLAAFMAGARADPTVDGLMVTMPHKRAIRDHLDAVSLVAERAGGVNAVKRLGGRLVGAQFDGIALVRALQAAGADLAGARVWLMGLGGAGLAIAQALHGRCGALLVTDSDAGRMATVLADLPLAEAAAAVSPPAADILINATPLGMRPDDASPFPAASVSRAHTVADIVADPNATRLAALATAAGKRLITGRRMVDHQIEPIADWLLTDTVEQAESA